MIGLLLALGCRGPAPAPPPLGAPPEPFQGREIATATIVATGDLLMHGRVKRSADRANVRVDGISMNNEGFDALWAGVAPRIAEADLAFANLETPVAPIRGNAGVEMVFNAPTSLLDSLKATGFDVVSFANNHAYDQGRPGLIETLEHIEAARLTQVGAGPTCAEALRARLFEVDGLRLAFLGVTDLFNVPLNRRPDEPCVAELVEGEVLREVARARAAGADAVFLSIHWGIEYQTEPLEAQVDQARRLIDGGVDVILGHHPHVLQRIEEIPASDGRVGLVAYSLGNFVSNQSAWYEPGDEDVAEGYTRDGILLSFRIARIQYGRRIGRIRIADVVAIPLWTSNDTRSRSRDPLPIHVDPTHDRIASLEAELARATDPRAIARLRAEIAEMERRVAAVRQAIGERYVPEPAPR